MNLAETTNTQPRIARPPGAPFRVAFVQSAKCADERLQPRRRGSIDPDVKSWVDNVIVPALVDRWAKTGAAS